MICKSIQYREQFSSKMKIFIWMSVHNERYEHQWTALAWSSVMFMCINKLTEIHKKLCQTIYITQMENKNTKHKYIRDVHIAYLIQLTCITHGNCTDDTIVRDYYLQKEHVSMETDK